jgi:hypothetical protein
MQRMGVVCKHFEVQALSGNFLLTAKNQIEN